MKYRKKPVVIEAVQYKGCRFGVCQWSEYPKWVSEAFEHEHLFLTEVEEELYVQSLEEDHHVSAGDYIIRGIKGELYTCKPDIFELTYETVK